MTFTASAPPPDSVQALFNRIAPVYDTLNDRLSFGQHRVWKQMAVLWSQAQPGQTCLDLCCGSGDLARRLAKVVGPKGRVVGLDFAPNLLDIARQQSQAYSQITWQEGDAMALPFADASFDAITMGYGLRNVQDIPTCLREMRRVLKPGGRAAVLDFNQPRWPWLQTVQKWYLDTLVVPAAEQMGLKEEYAYIFPSLERFPTGPAQISLGLEAGFAQAHHYAIAAEMMGVLVLQV